MPQTKQTSVLLRGLGLIREGKCLLTLLCIIFRTRSWPPTSSKTYHLRKGGVFQSKRKTPWKPTKRPINEMTLQVAPANLRVTLLLGDSVVFRSKKCGVKKVRSRQHRFLCTFYRVIQQLGLPTQSFTDVLQCKLLSSRSEISRELLKAMDV